MNLKFYKWTNANLPMGKNAIIVNASVEDTKISADTETPIHHIQMLDRSGSMHGSISQLIDDVKKIIQNMKKTDYFSVITFAGEGDYEVILKGVPRNIDDETLNQYFILLDSYKIARGCTSFVQPIEESKSIGSKLVSICPNIVISLFTDGEPVSSIYDEYSEVSNLIESMRNDIIAFNTIGYGNYYNKEYLIGWAQSSNFGTFNHASNIDDYLEIFDNNYEAVKDLCFEPINFDIPTKSNNDYVAKIYYSHSQASNCQRLLNNKIFHLSKNKNQFILVYDDDFEFKINDEVIKTSDIQSEVYDSWIQGFYYRLAYAEYKSGHRKESLSILFKNLHDKKLIDQISNSFTNDECLLYEKNLKRATFNTEYRNPNTCSDDYLPDENSPCLLNVLELLFDDGKSMYDYEATKYNRIGRKVNDEFNMFEKDSDSTIVPLNDIVFNEGEGKLNISIRFPISGHVNINPKQAREVKLPDKYPAKIFRIHTLIKDGNVNMDTITVYVTPDTYNKLNINYPSIIEDVSISDYDGLVMVKLGLNNLPVINASYSKYSILEIYNMIKEKTIMRSHNKVFKYYLDKCPRETSTSISTLTPEQIKLLSEYGIKGGIYSGIDNHLDNKENCDVYFVRTLKFCLKGFSTLSSVESAMKKPKNGDKYMVDAIEACERNQYSREQLEDLIKENNRRIRNYDTLLCGCKMSKILTGDWFEDLESTKDSNKFIYNGGEIPMNVTLNKEKCYVSVD